MAHLTLHFFTWSSSASVGSLSSDLDKGRTRFLRCLKSGKSSDAPANAASVPCGAVDLEGVAALLKQQSGSVASRVDFCYP